MLITPAGAVLVAQIVLIVSQDGETAFAALCFAVGSNPVNDDFFNGLLPLRQFSGSEHEALEIGCGRGIVVKYLRDAGINW